MASGQIYIPPETYVLGDLIRAWPRWKKLTWSEKVWLFCAHFDRHKHRQDFDIETFSPLADRAQNWSDDRRHLHCLLHEFYNFMAEQHGYTTARWGDKTPWNTMHLDKIVPFFKGAAYIHLIRDGRDVVASQIAADMRDTTGSVERYISANNACEKHLKNAQHVLKVRYEDLVSVPEQTFENIFNWAGMRFQADFLTQVPKKLGDVDALAHHANVLKPITPDSIGKWKNVFSHNDVEAFGKPFGDQLQRYGYA